MHDKPHPVPLTNEWLYNEMKILSQQVYKNRDAITTVQWLMDCLSPLKEVHPDEVRSAVRTFIEAAPVLHDATGGLKTIARIAKWFSAFAALIAAFKWETIKAWLVQ